MAVQGSHPKENRLMTYFAHSGETSEGACFTAFHNPNHETCSGTSSSNPNSCHQKFRWYPHNDWPRRVRGMSHLSTAEGGGSARPYLLQDGNANLVSASATDTGCALCWCQGETGVSSKLFGKILLRILKEHLSCFSTGCLASEAPVAIGVSVTSGFGDDSTILRPENHNLR